MWQTARRFTSHAEISGLRRLADHRSAGVARRGWKAIAGCGQQRPTAVHVNDKTSYEKEPPMTAPPGVVSDERNDAAVIERSLHEPDRFGAIFDAYFAEIHRYVARRLDAQSADDIAAETFAVAFRQRDRYDLGRGNARPWLYGIATNLIGRHRRGELRKLHALRRLDGRPERVNDHEDQVAAKVSAEGVRGRLAKAVAALPADQRDVLLLVRAVRPELRRGGTGAEHPLRHRRITVEPGSEEAARDIGLEGRAVEPQRWSLQSRDAQHRDVAARIEDDDLPGARPAAGRAHLDPAAVCCAPRRTFHGAAA
jgi:RNA polymerase sigma-70 factor (ECF subfamily)